MVICCIGTFAMALLIFYLTSQTAEQTTALTNKAVNALSNAVIQPTFGSNSKVILGPRQVAHIYQFLLLGLFATSAVILTFIQKKSNLLKCSMIGIIICAIYSLFDQLHKIFVPGRHFDSFDLFLDAIGYLLATLIITGIYIIRILVISKSKREFSD